MASFNKAVIAPSTFKSETRIESPEISKATRIFETLFCRSFKSRAKQRTAIISVATVISKPSSLGTPFTGPPSPISIVLKARSFKSTALFHSIRFISIFSSFP